MYETNVVRKTNIPTSFSGTLALAPPEPKALIILKYRHGGVSLQNTVRLRMGNTVHIIYIFGYADLCRHMQVTTFTSPTFCVFNDKVNE